jgi:hypothetical protein
VPDVLGRDESTVPGVPGRDERSVPGVPHSSLPLAPDRDGRSLPGVKYCRVESSLAGVVRTRYLMCHVGIKIVCQVEQCPWCARWSSALGVSGGAVPLVCQGRRTVCLVGPIG